MAQFELKENKVAIFKNSDKKEDKHPDYKGHLNLKGELIDIALWLSTAKNGTKYFSGLVSEPFKKDAVNDAVKQTTDSEKQTEQTDLPF